MARENYYILLELDPSVSSEDSIEKAIEKKQSEWSAQRNHPRKGRVAQLYLEKLQDIKHIMGRDDLRSQEADEATQLIAEQKKVGNSELSKSLKIITAKGYVLEEDIKKLAKKFDKIFSEKEIRSRISCPIQKKETKTTTKKRVLDRAPFNEINDRLKILQKQNLYNFLELSSNSSLKALQRNTQNKDTEIRKINFKGAEVTASQELIGYCLKVFKDEGEREKYDNALAGQGLIQFEKLINLAGSGGKLQIAEFEMLIKEAATLSIPLEEAESCILNCGQKRGWVVEKSVVSTPVDFQTCGNCGGINSKKANKCSNCGENLVIQCFKCRTKNSSENRSCSNCGLSIGDYYLVKRLIRDAKVAIAHNETQKARSLLGEAEVYWAGFSEISQLLKDVTSKEKDGNKKSIDVQEALADVQAALQSKLYFKSKVMLSSVKQLVPKNNNVAALEAEITKEIDKANQYVVKANQLERDGNSDAAAEAYMDALHVCADYDEAKQKLAKCPPTPPTNFVVSTYRSHFALKWEKSLSKGDMLYMVYRKVGSRPANNSDGKLLTETRKNSYEDVSAIDGEVYYYAVYSNRSGVVSLDSIISDPCMRTADVSKLLISSGDGSLTLNWVVPVKAKKVEIWRKEGQPPEKAGDGILLKDHGLDSISDTSVVNGVQYGYTLYAIFQDHKGDIIRSKGETCTAIPAIPPDPVKGLSLSVEATHILLTWEPPKDGKVSIFASTTKPEYECGGLISSDEVNCLGRVVPPFGKNSARDRLSTYAVVYYIPVTQICSTYIVGESICYSSVNDIENLSTDMDNNMLILKWKWPKSVSNVLVCFRRDAYPIGVFDFRAEKILFSKAKYESLGGSFRYAFSGWFKVYIRVFSAVSANEKWIYSGGLSKGAQSEFFVTGRRIVSYQIKQKKWFQFFKNKNEYEIVITVNKLVKLPELFLKVTSDTIPVNRFDGIEVLTIKKGSICEPGTPLIVKFDGHGLPVNAKAKLFTRDQNENGWIEFVRKSEQAVINSAG